MPWLPELSKASANYGILLRPSLSYLEISWCAPRFSQTSCFSADLFMSFFSIYPSLMSYQDFKVHFWLPIDHPCFLQTHPDTATMWDLQCKGLARWDSVLPMQPRNSETGLWKDQPGSQQLHICASFPLFLSSILSCSWEKSDGWSISLARKHFFTIMGTGLGVSLIGIAESVKHIIFDETLPGSVFGAVWGTVLFQGFYSVESLSKKSWMIPTWKNSLCRVSLSVPSLVVRHSLTATKDINLDLLWL